MTRNLKALLRLQLIMAWRAFRQNLGGTESKWQVLLVPLVLLSFVPFMLGMGAVAFGLYVGGKLIGQGHLVLVFALTAGQLACLIFGIFYVISAFFFSKDVQQLVPLPIRPSEIVVAKFLPILAGEYLTITPVVLPALVVYGALADVSWTYPLFALIIFLLLPVVPLVFASLFSLVLMRVTNLKRSRDLFRVVGALFGVVIALGFQFVIRLGQGGGRSEDIRQLLESKTAQAMGRWVPTSVWATEALREGAAAYGFPAFLLFAGVAVAALLLMMWVAERLFFGGLLDGDAIRSSGRALAAADLARETSRMRSPLWALLIREVRLLGRTPSFLMAALLPLVMLPLVVLMPLLQDAELVEMLAEWQQLAGSPWVPVSGMAAVMLFSAMTNVGATAISREGRFLWISRSLPVSPRLQVQAKVLHSLLFALMVVALVLGVLGFLGLLTPSGFLYVLVGGLLASLATICGGMALDILRPNLKWTDPQQAMKGNWNGLFALLLTLGLGLVLGIVSFVLYWFARPLLLPGLVVLFAAEAYGLYQLATRLAERRYREYED